MNNKRTLVLDIETSAEDWTNVDKVTQKMLQKSIKAKPKSAEYKHALEELKTNMVFSPTTGFIVAIGLYDVEQDKGVVYYSTGDKKGEEFTEENITYKPMSEKDMLEAFWEGARKYTHFITYNGRGFDVPYLVARSAAHNIRPTKNLMANRYVNSQPYDTKHIDLFDQLSHYGAVWKAGSLHLWCRLFGITSPKEDGVSGDNVTQMYRDEQYKEIAQYNARDIIATAKLYRHWDKYLNI